MAAARVAAGGMFLMCQEPAFTGPLPNRRNRDPFRTFGAAHEIEIPAAREVPEWRLGDTSWPRVEAFNSKAWAGTCFLGDRDSALF
jgi:hypothetical protein